MSKPEDYLRYRTREQKVIKEMKIYGKVKPETWEGYMESERVRRMGHYDEKKSTKMRLSRSSGNFYTLRKILSVQMIYRMSLKLRHMEFISVDNFAHHVIGSKAFSL